MAVDGRSRQELYRRLEEVLGREAATTLIEHLPPVGWADVATKLDLAELEERISLRFERVQEHADGRFNVIDERFNRMDERFNSVDDRIAGSAADLHASFEHELRSQITTVMFGLASVVLTMAALAFALARFT